MVDNILSGDEVLFLKFCNVHTDADRYLYRRDMMMLDLLFITRPVPTLIIGTKKPFLRL